jgi:hypothetical protein
VVCTCSRLAAADLWTVSSLFGDGNHVTLIGVEAQIPSSHAGRLGEDWSWSLSWAGDVSYWRAEGHVDSNRSLWEGGFTPVITLRRLNAPYYLEGGIGVHLLSHTSIDERDLSTQFQFGEMLGGGINFGGRRQYTVGVRVQHLSNGGIKEPNNGITFGEIRLSYLWD